MKLARLNRILAGLCLCGAAWFSSFAYASPEAEALYLQAMQAISEGRSDEARHILQILVEMEPQHAGAWLDLALIQCALGHAEEAERLFSRIENSFHPPKEILAIIQARRASACQRAPTPSHWNVLLSRGYEQNVNQGASNPLYTIGNGSNQIELPLSADFLPRADHYLLLAADYQRPLNRRGSSLFAQFQGRRNDALSQYDSSSLFIGMEHPLRWRNWKMQGNALIGLLSLGGHSYQKQSQLQWKVTPPLPLPKSMQLQVSSTVSHLQYMTLANFDANTFELRTQLQYKEGELAGHASLALQNDHANGDRPGGRRRGWQASLQARTRLNTHLFAEFGWTLQNWHGQSAYSPGFIDQRRQQAMHSTRLALVWPRSEKQSLQLEFRQVRNKENISIFQYNNRQIQLSWLWQGQ